MKWTVVDGQSSDTCLGAENFEGIQVVDISLTEECFIRIGADAFYPLGIRVQGNRFDPTCREDFIGVRGPDDYELSIADSTSQSRSWL